MRAEIDPSCFPSSYPLARANLLQGLAKFPVTLLREHQAFLHPLPCPEQQPLYLDWLKLGQSDTPQRVLVLICATHGVEGFAGAAVLAHSLRTLATQLDRDPQLGVILIHGLNPWGFAWLRRYDHENIDLNRNFIEFSRPLPESTEYDGLHNDLFRASRHSPGEILDERLKHSSREAFTATVTRGQYQHADGLFYGGNHASWSRQILEQACDTPFLQQAARIAVIDVHTGLGPFGHGEVINDHEPGSAGFELARQWYGDNAQSALLGESCSSPKRGLLDYFWHKLMGARGCFVTLEFGTYSADNLLIALIEEQRYQNRCAAQGEARDPSHPTVTALRDFFYPQDNSWRELVLFRASQIIGLALRGLQQ